MVGNLKTQEEVPEFARKIIDALERQGFVYYLDPSQKAIKSIRQYIDLVTPFLT